MPPPHLAVEVFCSYAHEDEPWLRKLETHLGVLQRQGLIALWHDRLIVPGTNWARSIDTHLETASVILLFISMDFFASDYCIGIEMKRALERQDAGEALVIPIVVHPVNWQHSPFGHLQALPTDAKPLSICSDEETALAEITAGLRRAIEDVPLLVASAPRTSLPKIWMIPYPRNPFFLGREDLLSTIAIQLQAGQTIALSGLGGIGKTQIAVEYAYRYCQEYQMVLWAHAESVESLNASYVQIAAQLNLPEKDAQKQEIVVGGVKTWLQNHRGWLLILDNADELVLLEDFLPPVVGGHLLITTRASATGRLARRLEVKTFTQQQGAVFLLRRASLLALDDPLSQASEQDQRIAQAIAHELGALPLALDQAGAYLEQTGSGLSEYLQIYQSHRMHLLSERGKLVVDHPEAVATTWSLSFARVEQKNPTAASMLRLCAFLSADAIPVTLMRKGVKPIARDTLALNQAIETLRAYSLVNYNLVSQTLSLHRLLQVVVRDALPKKKQKAWIQRAVILITLTFPDPTQISQWGICEQLLPHALICIMWIQQLQMSFQEEAKLLFQTGRYLFECARYAEAEPLYQQALSIWEQETEPDYLKIARSLNSLAFLYERQGRYTEAEPLYQRALIVWEQGSESDNHEIATCLNNLAELYRLCGRYTEAEALYQRTLAFSREKLGLEHPETAHSLNNLALLYHAQGKYIEAEPLSQQALSIREQVLGSEHPATTMSIHNMAKLYHAQGKYSEAEALYRQTLALREQVLGEKHPFTATCLNNLGELYHEQGRYAEAEVLYQRALAIREQMLGERHPFTATCLNNLAKLYHVQNRYAEAEMFYQQAWHIRQQRLGSEHPHTQITRSYYASFLRSMGRNEEARKVEESY